MNRRECLTTAAAVAAGTALLNEAIGQEKNPAALVADKTSSLKITGMRTYWVNPVVFVKIETNHGATGWGEIKAIDPRVAKVLAESLFSLIEGENPTRIEYLWQKVYRAHRDIRGGPFMVHTLAGIPARRLTSTAWSRSSRRPAKRSARTARSCSTPIAPCRRRR
jgi:galactonate dehydratase